MSAPQATRASRPDLTKWLEYFTAGLAIQLDEVRARGERAIRRDVIAKEYGLSARHAVALDYVLEHGSLAIQDYELLCPGVNRRTLQRDLKLLISKGLFDERGTSPTDPTKQYVLAGETFGPTPESDTV